jgi:CheY-like chemotaxis protein
MLLTPDRMTGMPSKSHVTSAGEDIQKLHILLVDDDALVLDVLEGALRAMGVKLITRSVSGSDAIDKLIKVERVVDCILADYSMANGNGLQLLRAIRMGKIKYVRPDACVIMVTASGAPDLVEAATQLDVSGYLVKPVTPAALLAAIKRGRSKYFPLDLNKYANAIVPDVTP